MNAFIPRPARQYTDERRVELHVAKKLRPLFPLHKVIAAQDEAKRLVAGMPMNAAIESACAVALPGAQA